MKVFFFHKCYSTTFKNKNLGQFNIEYKRIGLEDGTEELISNYFGEAFDFINSHLENSRKVLVHCKQGRSRSCAIILSYLMLKQKIPFKKGFDIIFQARPLISINPGFIRQLQDLEAQLNVTPPVTSSLLPEKKRSTSTQMKELIEKAKSVIFTILNFFFQTY